MKTNILVVTAIFLFGLSSFAATSSPSLSYDISGGTGSRNGESYSEIHLGLNWYLQDWLNWRNSVFSQFGSNVKSVYGLDSATLFSVDAFNQSRTLGVEVYTGPGVRLATENSNAVFGTAGITFALGGLRLGGGVQALHYMNDRTDKFENALNNDETIYFISISGGGSL